MITKAQLKERADSNNRVKHSFEMPWDETSLARVYDKIDATVEGGALIDVVSVNPLSYNPDNQSMTVEIVMDISDMLEEIPVED